MSSQTLPKEKTNQLDNGKVEKIFLIDNYFSFCLIDAYDYKHSTDYKIENENLKIGRIIKRHKTYVENRGHVELGDLVLFSTDQGIKLGESYYFIEHYKILARLKKESEMQLEKMSSFEGFGNLTF